LHAVHINTASEFLEGLKAAGKKEENMFSLLMEATKHCSLGQITAALFHVGGQYRRNM
jgi:methylmalonyl-CoA mutase